MWFVKNRVLRLLCYFLIIFIISIISMKTIGPGYRSNYGSMSWGEVIDYLPRILFLSFFVFLILAYIVFWETKKK
jgi:hypothetical protein